MALSGASRRKQIPGSQDTVSESTESLRDIIWLLAPSLKLRAEKLHAKLEIDSSPGSGTALTLVLNRSKLVF